MVDIWQSTLWNLKPLWLSQKCPKIYKVRQILEVRIFLAAASSSISPVFRLCVCVCVCVSVCVSVCLCVRYVLWDIFQKVNLDYFLKSQVQKSQKNFRGKAYFLKKCPTKKRNAQTHTHTHTHTHTDRQTHRRKTGLIELLSQLKKPILAIFVGVKSIYCMKH